MKKEGRRVLIFLIIALILVFSVLSLSIIKADDTTDETSITTSSSEQDRVDGAYDCLKDEIDEKTCDILSVEEQAFSLITVGKCKEELRDNGNNDECWPSSNCRLRDTALAVLALDKVKADTSDSEEWLLAQKRAPEELEWYLQIDPGGESICKIGYDGSEKTIKISEDKKVDKNAGTCFTLAYSNYWLKIDSSCYSKNFTVSCDKDFISALSYMKKNSDILNVPSQTESAPAEGTTKHKINSYCFKQGTTCNYEGSLWATYALYETNNDVSAFLPYLMALAEDNEQFFPETFLHLVTGRDEYSTVIFDEQKSAGYWEISSSPYHKFYDTSLALLSIYTLDAPQSTEGKDYLLEVQDENGCWNNNIAQTAFILYAAWPKAVSPPPAPSQDDCEDFNYYCTFSADCSEDDTLENFYCLGSSSVCCKTQPAELTCDEKQGIICSDNEECSGGNYISASDSSSCCSGSCVEIEVEKTECELNNYTCSYSCTDDQEEKDYACDGNDVCCAPKTSSSWWLWIILLLILITLVALAIIFREKLKPYWYKIQDKFKRKRKDSSGTS